MCSVLESERIYLQPPSLDLVDEVRDAVLESRSELERYLTWVSEFLDNPQANMETAISNFESFENELRYFITDRSTSLLLGAIGLIIRDAKVPFFEIGYWIRTSQAGNGYVSEAITCLEEYAFSHLSANRIEIRAAASNTVSRSVAERCGYHLDAMLENSRRLPSGELADTVIYSKVTIGESFTC